MRRGLALVVAIAAVTATPARTEAAPRPVALRALEMLDAAHGYALSGSQAYRLLRTADGGRSWTDITPGGGQLHPGALPGVRGSTVLVAAALRTGTFVVLRSGDAGRSWQRSRAFRDAHGQGIGQPLVLDAVHAAVAVDEGAAAGSQGEALFTTADGGRTWRLASRASVASTPAGSLPFGCDKNGFGFATVRRGWAGGTCAGGRPFFYRTEDGGKTWHRQALPGLGDCECDVAAPVFFSARTGAVAVFGWAETGAASPLGHVYWTTDGGRSWRESHAAWGRATQAVAVGRDFAWVVTAPPGRIRGPFNRLFRTVDGGHSWQAGTLAFGAADYRLDAVSGTTAFAYRVVPGAASLLRTDDGGRTWRALRTVVSG